MTEPPVSTEHGFRAYLPRPHAEHRGVALCLSGGVFRPALFHLGALRRLSELGVLSAVDTVTSVSGGGIAAAQLATHRWHLGTAWPRPGEPLADFDGGVARPLRRFCAADIRTRPALIGVAPFNWPKQNAGIDALSARYAEGPAPGRLVHLPPHPRFVFCASDLTDRTQLVFDCGERRVGSDGAGFTPLG